MFFLHKKCAPKESWRKKSGKIIFSATTIEILMD